MSHLGFSEQSSEWLQANQRREVMHQNSLMRLPAYTHNSFQFKRSDAASRPQKYCYWRGNVWGEFTGPPEGPLVCDKLRQTSLSVFIFTLKYSVINLLGEQAQIRLYRDPVFTQNFVYMCFLVTEKQILILLISGTWKNQWQHAWGIKYSISPHILKSVSNAAI